MRATAAKVPRLVLCALSIGACSTTAAPKTKGSSETPPQKPKAPAISATAAATPAMALRPQGFGRGFAPPTEHGQSRTLLAGCVAAPSRGTAPATRSSGAPSPEVTPGVSVQMLGSGIFVTHQLRHACCLNATITTKVEGDKIHIQEALAGKMCRCMCASTLKTAVGLKPGDYSLVVRLGDKSVHEQKVSIRPLARP